ncbi:hypothetical protein F5050DRAFT_1813233 [Lentinula boryana]|uniref:Uncharacterized protein n=1 Tax=Lentinula boryana TaxID=40481 RepID=A0ABQ8PZ76_9AGAR|nr:hypothetical protein F5050DRAFT_1813233 [Lentinula boryana]
MHRHYPERSRHSSAISPYDSSRSRRYQHYRGPSPTSVLERHEAARAPVLSDDKVQHHEVQELQLSRAKRKRAKVHSEDKDDGRLHRDTRIDDNEVYVMMEVTKRERIEILRRQRERGVSSFDKKIDKSQMAYQIMTMEEKGTVFYQDLLFKQEQYGETHTQHSGPSVLKRAANFTIMGGQLSAVGGDQTIIGTPERYSSLVLPRPSNNLYRTPRNHSPSLGRTRYRRESSRSSKPVAEISGPSVFTQATSFDIYGGEFSAGTNVKKSIRTTSALFVRMQKEKIKASSTSSSLALIQGSSLHEDRETYPVRPRSPSARASISGPSVFAHSSGFTLYGSIAHLGSFSAVGGDDDSSMIQHQSAKPNAASRVTVELGRTDTLAIVAAGEQAIQIQGDLVGHMRSHRLSSSLPRGSGYFSSSIYGLGNDNVQNWTLSRDQIEMLQLLEQYGSAYQINIPLKLSTVILVFNCAQLQYFLEARGAAAAAVNIDGPSSFANASKFQISQGNFTLWWVEIIP